jgi:hypothetical protein
MSSSIYSEDKIGEAKYFHRYDKTRTANVLNCFKNDRSSQFIGEVKVPKIRCVNSRENQS